LIEQTFYTVAAKASLEAFAREFNILQSGDAAQQEFHIDEFPDARCTAGGNTALVTVCAVASEPRNVASAANNRALDP
jgi:hypothetical protein